MKRATTLREVQKQLEKEAGTREKSKIYVINPVNNTKLPYYPTYYNGCATVLPQQFLTPYGSLFSLCRKKSEPNI